MEILGAMQTPDGVWRVEAVRERGQHSYQIIRDGQPIARGLPIGAVEWILYTKYRIDLASLRET